MFVFFVAFAYHTQPPDFRRHKVAGYRLVYPHSICDGTTYCGIWTCRFVAFPGMKPLACGVVTPFGGGPELSSRVP